MAKEDPRDRIRREQLEIASAEGLFQDESAVKSKPSRDASSGSEFGSGETFALADGPSSVDLPPPAPVAPTPRATPKRDARPPRPSKAEQSADSPMLEPSALVEEVWSRTAEWGSTVLLVGGMVNVRRAARVFWAWNRAYLGILADFDCRWNGCRCPFLPDLDHARTPGAHHSRTSPPRLLWFAVASPAPLSPDVVALEHGRTDLDGIRFIRGFQGVLERSSGQHA